jgi:hypothetical protein
VDEENGNGRGIEVAIHCNFDLRSKMNGERSTL